MLDVLLRCSLSNLEWALLTLCPYHTAAAASAKSLQSCPTLQPTRLLHPWDFPGKVLEWGAIAFSALSHYLTVKNEIALLTRKEDRKSLGLPVWLEVWEQGRPQRPPVKPIAALIPAVMSPCTSAWVLHP